MQDTAQTKTPAIIRTWAVTIVYRECSVVTDVRDYIVTLDRSSGKLEGYVNGEVATAEQAVRLLENAEFEPVVLGQILQKVAV